MTHKPYFINISMTVIVVLSLSMTVIVVLSLMVIYLLGSGRVAPKPRMTVKADNCYTETLHVITDEDYRPYSFREQDGSFAGHEVELVTLIANDLKMNLDLKFMPWLEAVDTVLKREADLLMTGDLSDSFDGAESLLKTEYTALDDFTVYSKNDIKSLDKLLGKRIAVIKNGNVIPHLSNVGLGKWLVQYESNQEAMKAVVRGDVDCAIMRNTIGTIILGDMPSPEGIKARMSVGRSFMCFDVNPDRQDLVKRINESLEKMRQEGIMNKLDKKWLTTFVRPYTIAEIILYNPFIDLVFLFLVTGIIWMTYMHKRGKEQRVQQMAMIAGLANDFESIDYVTLHTDKTQDTTISYRESEEFSQNVSQGGNEWFFTKKLDYLHQNLVYGPDKDKFYDSTRRSVILDNLRQKPAYFVDFRMEITGKVKYYQMKISGDKAEDGTMRGFIIGIHDIDADVRSKMEQQAALQDALFQAQAASRAKTAFLNNMSHDIRTPMNAIIGFTRLAADHLGQSEKVQDYLGKISQSSDLLLSLINDVLDMSRIESGKLTLQEKEEHLPEILRTLKDIVWPNIQAKRQSLSMEASDIHNENVICDRLRLNQILLNLLSNANKYTPQGGSIRLHIKELPSSRPGYGTYNFNIKDNGIGMPPSFLKVIFEPFARANSATVNGIQGTGLGMAITKNIIDMMQGKINIQSAEKQGTDIHFTLHFKLGENPQDQPVAELNGKHALVVGKDSTCLNAVEMLKDLGMRPECQDSVIKAIARMQAAKTEDCAFTACILDWSQLEDDRLEQLRAVRLAIGDKASILVLAPHGDVDLEHTIQTAGAAICIHTPLFPSDLRKVLQARKDNKDDGTAKSTEPDNFTGKKLLLVEDNELNREIALELLHNYGFDVDVAENGQIAVAAVRDKGGAHYDCILMDIQMPIMNGYEATAAIRALPDGRTVPIIALSANAFEEDCQKSRQAGMNAHVAKPIRVKELMGAFHKVFTG